LRTSNNPSGRPQSLAATERLHASFWLLLETQPYESITMERLAAKAAVSRAALYRRYGSLRELALAALLRVGAQQVLMNASSDIRADLHSYLKAVVTSLDRRGKVGRAFRILLATVQTDDAMATPFRDFLTQRRDPVRLRLAAVDAGLSASQLDHLVDQLFGPILYRLLIRNVEVDDAAITAFVVSVVDRLPRVRANPE
jgi:AcrR family transcriptional regulator